MYFKEFNLKFNFCIYNFKDIKQKELIDISHKSKQI